MSMKNMAVMFGAMAFMRKLDQEEPMVLMYARMAFLGYIVITASIYIILHLRIVAQRDTTHITVPVASKAPSLSEAMAQAQEQAEAAERKKTDEKKEDEKEEEEISTEEEKPKEEVITVMEYDLRQLNTARRAWITNACILALIHYKMESVSPLVMSSLMGLMRLLSDDPLFQIHIRGTPAVGPLKRPFSAEKNPLAAMLKDMAPKPEGEKEGEGNTVTTRSAPVTEPAEDLHDDGDSDEDDSPPPAIEDLKDDHIKSDFDDEDEEKDNETKKSE